jgi:hypothetical protein
MRSLRAAMLGRRRFRAVLALIPAAGITIAMATGVPAHASTSGINAAGHKPTATVVGNSSGTWRRLSAEQRHAFISAYAKYRHIKASDVTSIDSPVDIASHSGRQYALIGFLAAPGLPAAVQDGFQDGGSTGYFIRSAGHAWTMARTAVAPVACTPGIPSILRKAWHLGTCPSTRGGQHVARHVLRPQASSPYASGTTIASIAEDQVGVADKPVSTSFGYDCNPYTTLVGNPDGAADCGTTTSNGSWFSDVENANEEWCADFTKWVWATAGMDVDMSTLNPGANSFAEWGSQNGGLAEEGVPQAGDAVVFYNSNYTLGQEEAASAPADHVGIVVSVSASSVTLVNGDFLGASNIGVQEDTVPLDGMESWAEDQWDHAETWVYVEPSMTRAPGVAVNASDGDQYVFWAGQNGGLWEASYNGSSWSRSELAGMGTLGSEPSAAVGPNGDVYVFWEGTNGDLWEGYWNGAWNGPIDLHDGPLGSEPTVGVDANGNQFVFWEGTNGGLWEAYYNGSWNGPILVPNMGPLGSSPTVAVSPIHSSGGHGYQYVFWEGTNGDLWEGYWNGAWNGPTNLGDGTLGSPPSAATDDVGNEYVFWTGGNGGLWETWFNGSTWEARAEIAGMGPLGSAPTVGVDAAGNQFVYWKGTNAELWQAYYNGSWSGPNNLGNVSATLG